MRTAEDLAAQVADRPSAAATVFPAVARLLGTREPVAVDAARGRVLDALAGALDPAALATEVEQLYRYGDADEKRAVLLALHRLPLPAASTLPLLLDALRTNDGRLVAAAVGPAGHDALPDEAWRHAVLKCLFTGVPLAAVAGLDDRADAETARMVAALVTERVTAGRDVPDDAWLVLRRFPDAVAASGLEELLASPHEDRREAARRALAARDAAPAPTGTPGTDPAADPDGGT
ncbi:EboA domain-containing protein [Aquipuribacter hungaricus]|uniref:EboA domain-containing protein n=1 Tax=Aquipuribacter hungaricus TaxID=545624 RepID=A0ABV7WC71_9MICO